MARKANKLTTKQIQSLKEPGRYSDGDGLYLKIAPSGSKAWVLMTARNGKRQELGLGSCKDVPLADARRKAADYRQSLANGIDPRKAGQGSRHSPTFGDIAEAHIERMAPSWRNPKHLAQWKMTLSCVRGSDGKLTNDGYCLSIRNQPVDGIDTEAVLGVLTPIWQDKAETATRLRGRIEAVLDAAKVAGHRDGPNPAAWKGHLALLLPARKKLSRGHHAAMPYRDVPGFIQKLHLIRGTGAFALEFAILTAARSGEVRLAHWPEINIAEGVWTIPAERMKAGRIHRVPLSKRALAILDTVAQLRSDNEGLVFPGTKVSKPLSDMTLTKVVHRHAADGYTVHGFRSSFRDWAGEETHFPREIAEQALAHQVGNETELAYRRADALAKRRELMTAWERFCLGG